MHRACRPGPGAKRRGVLATDQAPPLESGGLVDGKYVTLMCLAGESRVARSLPPQDPVRLPVLNRMSDDDGTAPCIARCIRTYWMGSIPSASESSLDDVRFLFSMSRQASIVLASTTPSKCTWYGVKPSCAEPLLRGHVCLLHPVVGAAGRLCLGPLICDDRRRLRDLKGLALARAGALCVVVRHALTLQASTIRPQVAMSIFTLSWPFRWPTAMGSTPSCVAVYVDHEPYAAPTRASSSLGKPRVRRRRNPEGRWVPS